MDTTQPNSLMQKTEATFQFTNYFMKHDGKRDGATVVLAVNYRTKTYDIRPFSNQYFQFTNTSYKWKMWKAVLKSIEDAIDFGNKELGVVIEPAPPVTIKAD